MPLPEAPITLHPYDPAYRADFERLNLAWLTGHGLLEAADLDYLRDPERHYRAEGGEVFFALQAGRFAGCCAALRVSGQVFELAKLAVEPWAKGHGLGRRLSEAVLDFARAAGAREVHLTSHTSLVSAIRLYEAMGFRHAPMPADVRYATANVFMTLTL